MANYSNKYNQFSEKEQVDIPSYLSEITPEEHAFFLLKRTRAAEKRKQRLTRLIQIYDLRLAFSTAPTFMEQFNRAARHGELI